MFINHDIKKKKRHGWLKREISDNLTNFSPTMTFLTKYRKNYSVCDIFVHEIIFSWFFFQPWHPRLKFNVSENSFVYIMFLTNKSYIFVVKLSKTRVVKIVKYERIGLFQDWKCLQVNSMFSSYCGYIFGGKLMRKELFVSSDPG